MGATSTSEMLSTESVVNWWKEPGGNNSLILATSDNRMTVIDRQFLEVDCDERVEHTPSRVTDSKFLMVMSRHNQLGNA